MLDRASAICDAKSHEKGFGAVVIFSFINIRRDAYSLCSVSSFHAIRKSLDFSFSFCMCRERSDILHDRQG